MKETKFTVWFKYMMVSRGMSYRALGAKTGYSATYICDLIHGNRQPTESIALNFIKCLNLNNEEQRILYDCVAESIDKIPYDVEKFLKNNPDVLLQVIEEMNNRKLDGKNKKLNK